jgi:ribonuclease I
MKRDFSETSSVLEIWFAERAAASAGLSAKMYIVAEIATLVSYQFKGNFQKHWNDGHLNVVRRQQQTRSCMMLSEIHFGLAANAVRRRIYEATNPCPAARV